MLNIGTPEIIIIAIVVLVLFGGKKMQEWARGIGEAGREIKKAKNEFETSFNDDGSEQKTKSSDSNTRKGVE